MKAFLTVFATFITLIAAHPQRDEAKLKPIPTQTADHCTLLHVSSTSHDDSVSAELLLSYVAKVDALLRDLAEELRAISEEVEAGELTPAQAQELKLETSREMIARLETISAVYEAIIFSGKDPKAPVNPGDRSSEASRDIGLQMDRTVSIDELLTETAQ
jgi:hypothetical protein